MILGQLQLGDRVVQRRRIIDPLEIPAVRRVARVQDRLGRSERSRAPDHATGREVVVDSRALEIRGQLQLFVEEQLAEAQPDGRALGGRAANGPFLVQITQRQPVIEALARTGESDRMFLPESVTLYGVAPVRVRASELAHEVRIVLLDRLAELLGGQHLRLASDVGTGHGAGVGQLAPHAARGGAPALRFDDHHTVGAPGAVNRRGRRVLEDGHRFDVIGVQEGQRVTPGRDPASDRQRHPVDHEQRLVARVHRGSAADPDRDPAARLAAVPLGNLDPGRPPSPGSAPRG